MDMILTEFNDRLRIADGFVCVLARKLQIRFGPISGALWHSLNRLTRHALAATNRQWRTVWLEHLAEL